MGAQQLETKAAKRLNALEKQLAFRSERIKEEQEHYDALFKEVFEVFDEAIASGAPARFICEDGYVLGRIIAHMSPTVDADKLIGLIKKHLTPLKATRMIDRVMTFMPVVIQSALAQEIVLGRIDERMVRQCITPKAPVIRRVRREASKQDKMSLEVGILESPTWEEESA